MLIPRRYVAHICWINSVFPIQFDFFLTYLYTVVLGEKSNIFLPENTVNSAFHFDLSHQKRPLFSESDYWIRLKLWIMLQFASFCREITWKLFKVLSLPIKKPFHVFAARVRVQKSVSCWGGFSQLLLSMRQVASVGETPFTPILHLKARSAIKTLTNKMWTERLLYQKLFCLLFFFFCNPFPCDFKSTTNLRL